MSELKNTRIAGLESFLDNAQLSDEIRDKFKSEAIENTELNTLLDSYFSNAEKSTLTPLFIYHENTEKITILVPDRAFEPPEPGEAGCILSFVRAFGLQEEFLPSDCYGQLSCSSCAVEVLAGKAENPVPRDEEYDMMDIDEEKPPTQFTRLSCQTVIGQSPLLLKIR